MEIIKLFFLLSLIFFSLSCSSDNQKAEIDKNDNDLINSNKKDKVIEKPDTSFFLGFKPQFNKDDFRKQISIENENGNMNGNLFSIAIDYFINDEIGGQIKYNKILDFKVSQINNQLILDYKEIDTNISLKNLTTLFSNQFESFLIIIDSLERKFNEKYEYVGFLDPYIRKNELNFILYDAPNMMKKVEDLFYERNLTQDSYMIFKGKNKTILLGSKFIGHKNETGFNELNKRLSKIKRENMSKYLESLEVFNNSLKIYREQPFVKSTINYIPDNYLKLKLKSSNNLNGINIFNDETALLLNDLGRLNSYEKSSLNYYFDCQIIYMTNDEFKKFQKKLKNDYSKLVSPLIDKEKSKMKTNEKNLKQKEANTNKL